MVVFSGALPVCLTVPSQLPCHTPHPVTSPCGSCSQLHALPFLPSVPCGKV